ncbi:MAG: flagellar biosynthesis protein FlgB [Alphaproteobacteria bacterium]|nr:flagellar biosynthesis protein FlgB [Alphaproteobacteria bacterium]
MLDQPYFAALRARLDLLSQRQKLISENVANASTPGYVPRDIDTSQFDRALASAMQRRASGMSPASSVSTSLARIVKSPDTETTLDGNAVELEDQVLKAAQTRQAYETSVALYQKGLALIRLAARGPGQ